MRTTLTLDDDVAARLEQLTRARRRPFKAVVNEALRAGLDALAGPRRPRPYRVKPMRLGASLIGSLDNVEEALARVEGEDHR
jgi:hypothetical protein